MTMTDERLAELDAVMAKATDGPWSTRQVAHGAGGHEPIYLVKVSPAQDRTLGAMTGDDGEAIAAAMNAYPDLRAHIDAQAATIALAIAIIEHCDVTEGVCCCGDDMDTHAEPMSCGHSPVDHGSYTASQWLDEARATLTGAASE